MPRDGAAAAGSSPRARQPSSGTGLRMVDSPLSLSPVPSSILCPVAAASSGKRRWDDDGRAPPSTDESSASASSSRRVRADGGSSGRRGAEGLVCVRLLGWVNADAAEAARKSSECGEACGRKLSAVSDMFKQLLTGQHEPGNMPPSPAWLDSGPGRSWARSGDGGVRVTGLEFDRGHVKEGCMAEDLTADGVRGVLRYAQAEQVGGATLPPVLTQPTALDLLVASAVLRVRDLFHHCVGWVQANLWPVAALEILRWPPQLPTDVERTMQGWYTELRDKCFRYVLGMFAPCKDQLAFLRLPYSVILAVARHDGLAAKEEQLLQAMMSWVKYDEGHRERYVEQLLQLVRFPQMKDDELKLDDEDSQVLNGTQNQRRPLVQALFSERSSQADSVTSPQSGGSRRAVSTVSPNFDDSQETIEHPPTTQDAKVALAANKHAAVTSPLDGKDEHGPRRRRPRMPLPPGGAPSFLGGSPGAPSASPALAPRAYQ